jgi:hypothetical protein
MQKARKKRRKGKEGRNEEDRLKRGLKNALSSFQFVKNT